jgi:dolichyl-diphosphooligosaccharide--protein glycosyltransferase
MTDFHRSTRNLLAERPESERTLRTLLDRDEPLGFEELPADSGLFGEIVESGVLEETDDGRYRLAEREAVRGALEGDREAARAGGRGSIDVLASLSERVRDIDRGFVAALAGALALVLLFRTWHAGSVYRKGDIVLLGNDPYSYRYWVEQIVDTGTIAAGSLPNAVALEEPLMVTTLSWLTAALGGSAEVAGHVLAWYPVVSAVIVALLVYILAIELSGDRRIGLASVALLAVTPAHAYRSALGFADHHAFDYPWLVATALALTVLSGIRREHLHDSKTWAWTVGFGTFVAGQTLSWDAAPVLLVPIGAYVAISTALAVREGRSPTPRNLIVATSLLLAATITYTIHAMWGWHSDAVTFAPALLFGGTAGVAALGALAHQFERSGRDVLLAEAVLGGAGIAVFGWLLPGYVERFVERIDFLLVSREIAESASLISGEMGSIVGPILIFGFVFFLGIPYLAWASWRVWDGGSSIWLPAVIYGWYFTVLAVIQLRFGGELSPFVSVFAGVGFVHLASTVDVARRPAVFGGEYRQLGSHLSVPEGRTMVTLVLLFGLVASLGVVQTGVKTSQLTIDGDAHDAAQWMEQDAERRNLSTDERYVFSQWGRNRMYNYFVRGESRSYGFADGYYMDFLRSSDPDEEWADRLVNRVGYVVLDGSYAPPSQGGTAYDQLYGQFSSAGRRSDGLAHYRIRYLAPDRELSVFSVVPGATIEFNNSSAPASVSTNVTVSKETFRYERRLSSNGEVSTAVTVAYPGTYHVSRNWTVAISERAVRSGAVIQAGATATAGSSSET